MYFRHLNRFTNKCRQYTKRWVLPRWIRIFTHIHTHTHTHTHSHTRHRHTQTHTKYQGICNTFARLAGPWGKLKIICFATDKHSARAYSWPCRCMREFVVADNAIRAVSCVNLRTETRARVCVCVRACVCVCVFVRERERETR